MSGGSFDYLYNKIDNGDILDYGTLEMLLAMAEWLAEPEQGQPQASAELKRIHTKLAKIKESVRTQSLIDLLKAAEWWASNDTGKDDFVEVWKKYKYMSF